MLQPAAECQNLTGKIMMPSLGETLRWLLRHPNTGACLVFSMSVLQVLASAPTQYRRRDTHRNGQRGIVIVGYLAQSMHRPGWFIRGSKDEGLGLSCNSEASIQYRREPNSLSPNMIWIRGDELVRGLITIGRFQ